VDTTPEAQQRRRLLPLYALTAVAAAGYGSIFTLTAAFRDRYGFDDTGVGLIVTVGFAAGFVTQVGLSRLADRGHAAKLIRAGVGVLVFSMVFMAAGSELWQFVAARALLGVGGGMIVPGARRMAINIDPEHMGHNLGVLGSFHLSGFVTGPALASVLNEIAGLRAPFLVMAAIAVIAAVFTGRLPEDKGALTTERRIVRGLLRRRGIQAALLMTVALYVMVGTFEALWAVMLTDLGSPTWVIGFTLSISTVPMILLGPWAGRLAQERGALRVAAAGLLLEVPCMAGYGALSSVALIATLSLVQAFGDSFSMPASRIAAATASPPDQHASTQGLVGAVEVLVAGVVALPAAWSYGHFGAGWTWLASALAMLAAIGVSLFIGRGLTTAGPSPVQVAELSTIPTTAPEPA
jgi:DHA1 family multidrug resistance protein-like MFS transporter